MTLTHDEMVKIVDNLYAATDVGDFDTAETMLTDDFFITEADGLPMAGVYSGITSLRSLYTKVMGMMDVVALQRGETITGTDTAVCHVTFQFADPSLKPAELLELFRFQGNLVCEIKPYYFDPAPIIAACEAKKRTG